MHARRDEPGDVGHVGHEQCPSLVGRLPEPGEVEHARISARAGDDQLRLVRARERDELVVVDAFVFPSHAVWHDIEEFAREVELMAVRQVSAVRQIHAEDGVAWFEGGEEHRHVRLRARVRLHIGMLGAEQRLCPRNRQRLDDVDLLAATVVAPGRISLCVLVRED
jgi:hypothetical protein